MSAMVISGEGQVSRGGGQKSRHAVTQRLPSHQCGQNGSAAFDRCKYWTAAAAVWSGGVNNAVNKSTPPCQARLQLRRVTSFRRGFSPSCYHHQSDGQTQLPIVSGTGKVLRPEMHVFLSK